jgi:hypothetical protein
MIHRVFLAYRIMGKSIPSGLKNAIQVYGYEGENDASG